MHKFEVKRKGHRVGLKSLLYSHKLLSRAMTKSVFHFHRLQVQSTPLLRSNLISTVYGASWEFRSRWRIHPSLWKFARCCSSLCWRRRTSTPRRQSEKQDGLLGRLCESTLHSLLLNLHITWKQYLFLFYRILRTSFSNTRSKSLFISKTCMSRLNSPQHLQQIPSQGRASSVWSSRSTALFLVTLFEIVFTSKSSPTQRFPQIQLDKFSVHQGDH